MLHPHRTSLLPWSSVSLLLLTTACASFSPDKIPEVREKDLPALRFDGLEPKTLTLTVHNARKVNQEAGNTAQVEKAVETALRGALTRGGIKIETSVNQLKIDIVDCDRAPQGTECVQLEQELTTRKGSYRLSSYAAMGYRREGHAVAQFGDVTEAYQDALMTAIHAWNKKPL